MNTNKKKLITTLVIDILAVAALAIACSMVPKAPRVDYRTIAFAQNELILYQEEKIEELATVIQAAMPAYEADFHDIDSVNLILDSLYTATGHETK